MKFTDYLEKKMLLEFARRGEVVRSGILLDEDDIEFLEQFPPKYWIRAIYQRYHDDLYEAVKQRHDRRKMDKEAMVDMLAKALVSGDFSELSPRLFSPETIRHLSSKYNSDWRSDYRTFGRKRFEEAAMNAAKEEVYYLAEKMNRHATEPPGEERTYTFKSRNKEYKIKAKPFINRLVHKIETTKGEEHHPESGLSGVGLYGFDMDEPQKGSGKIPHSTRGMQFVTYDMAKEAVGRLLKHNFHRYYGELPEDGESVEGKGEVSWKPVKVEKGGLKDDTLSEENKAQIKKSMVARVGNKFTTFKSNSFSISLKDGTSITKPSNSTTVVFKEPGKPPMRHAVSTSSAYDGFVENVAKREWDWMVKNDPEVSSMKGPPIPGHGTHSGGVPIKHDQVVHLPHYKKTIMVNGKPQEFDIPMVRPAHFFRAATEDDPDSQRSGYRKSIVPIEPDDYVKTPGYGGAAMHPNQNRPGEYAVPFGAHGYLDLMSDIFGSMEKYGHNHPDYPDCYKEIIEGIKSALKVRSRGVRDNEKAAVESNMVEMHDIVLSWMKKNISQQFMRDPSERVGYARNTVLRILKQDIHGGKSIRKRSLEMAARSRPYKSLLTPAQRALIEKLPEMTDQLAAAGRKLVAGAHAMPFGREGIEAIVRQIKQATDAMDQSDPIKNMDHASTTDEFHRITRDRFTRRAPLESAMRVVLQGIIFRETGRHGPALDSGVESSMGVVRKARTISGMVAAFQSLRVVQDFLHPEARETVPSRDPAAVSKMSKLPTEPTEESPQSRGMTRTWESLRSKQDYLGLVYNWDYMKNVKDATLLGVKSWIEKNYRDGTISAQDRTDAIDEIDDTLAKRRSARP